MGRGKNLALAASSAGPPVARFDAVFGVRRGNAPSETVDIVLSSPGERKFRVLRVLRDVAGISLLDGREIIQESPKVVKKGIARTEANTLKSALEEVGAIIILNDLK